jgi:streptomycin 6-kinase
VTKEHSSGHYFALPRDLLRDEERHDWIAALPDIVKHLTDRWSIVEVGDPFQPGGQSAWVAPVRLGDDSNLVLKIAWRHTEAAHEAAGLRVWDGQGAVRLHASAEFDHSSALLIERCMPGTSLARQPEVYQDAVIASLLHRLWQHPPSEPFRPLQVMCDQWADEFEVKIAAGLGSVDSGLARAGIELFRSLPSTADRSVLLCTDLHAENVLAAQREPWLVIDPKPYVGDPTYDALQHILNCDDRLRSDPRALCRRMSDLLDIDLERLLLWLFARCVQESPESPMLGEVARRLAPR